MDGAKTGIVWRRAEPSEAEALTCLCRAAKRHWGYPTAWMEAWAEDLRVTPDYLAASPVFVAELAGEIIGFFGLRREADDWHLEHLWLEPRHIGRGWGRALFAAAVAEARRLGATRLRIRSDPNAEAFYRHLGAVRTGLEEYDLLGTRRAVPHLLYVLPPASAP